MSNQQNGNLRVQKILNQLSEEEKKSSGQDVFSCVEGIAADSIFAVKTAYTNCKGNNKVNLGIGAYRDEDGKNYVLKVVKEAELFLAKQYEEKDSKDSNDSKGSKGCTKEYQGIPGDAEFIQLSQRLMLEPETLRSGNPAENKKIKAGQMAGVQSLSGTGALRVLLAFIKNTLAKNKPELNVIVSKPTWGNHKKIIRDAGLAPGGKMENILEYPYIAKDKVSLDFDAMLDFLNSNKTKEGDIILLHACAHNPTGVDPNEDQWNKIRAAMKKNKLVPFFDCAYQGFATGSLEKDSEAVRAFAKEDFDFLLAQSYAKNLGLYGERIGCASVMCQSKEAADRVQSQLNGVVRPMYSNPPRHGMEIVKFVLGNKEKFASWEQELLQMSGRIKKMRKELKTKLEELKVPSPYIPKDKKTDGPDWSHITQQIGMFSFTGLEDYQVLYCREFRDKEQREKLSNGIDIYFLESGRISMAGLNSKNVEKVARGFAEAIRDAKPKEPKEKSQKEQQ